MIFQGNETKFNGNGFFKANPIVNPIYSKVLKQTNLDFLTSLKKIRISCKIALFNFFLKSLKKTIKRIINKSKIFGKKVSLVKIKVPYLVIRREMKIVYDDYDIVD